ncbi:MAG: hypothetical protein ACFB00_07280 [Parvularculaceae bacterium]
MQTNAFTAAGSPSQGPTTHQSVYTSNLKTDINRITAWTVATPILGIWFFASFLPFFGLFEASGRTAITIVLDFVFLGTGFAAVFGIYMFARFSATGAAREIVSEGARGSALKLAAYASVWLTLYFIYRWAA